MVVSSALPAMNHSPRLLQRQAARQFAGDVRFGNAAAAKAVVTALESPPVQSFFVRAFKFLTSTETFYRFWTEILAATLSGCFLLASAKIKLKNAAAANGAYNPYTGGANLQTQAYLMHLARGMTRPMGGQRLNLYTAGNPFQTALPLSRIAPTLPSVGRR